MAHALLRLSNSEAEVNSLTRAILAPMFTIGADTSLLAEVKWDYVRDQFRGISECKKRDKKSMKQLRVESTTLGG